jgi:hypothetical protein
MTSSYHEDRQQKRRRHVLSSTIQCIVVLLVLEVLAMYRLYDVNRGLEHVLQQVKVVSSNLATTTSFSAVGINELSMKCQNQPVWSRDLTWRNAVLQPEICSVSAKNRLISMSDDAFHKEQSALLQESFLTKNADFTPCGANCVFHLDSAYSFLYGWKPDIWLDATGGHIQ